MNCPNCQHEVAASARFCPSCGTALATDADGTMVIDPVDADRTAAVPVVDATRQQPPVSAGRLRTCPSCGAENSAGRVLCARCGVDLDAGTRPVATPVVHHPGPAEDVAGDVTPPRRRSRAPMIVAVVVVAGAVLGLLIGLWLAGSGQDAGPAAPEFDAGVYNGEPEALAITGVGASSTRPPAGNTEYGAGNLVDDDLATSWSHDPAVEAAEDVDLALELAEPAWVTALTFANGAQADDLAFTADGRLLRLRLLVDGDAAAELQLLDQQGLQRVTLPEPVLVDTIRLVVLEVVEGDTYEEVSLSELVVTGHPARGEDLERMVTGEQATG